VSHWPSGSGNGRRQAVSLSPGGVLCGGQNRANIAARRRFRNRRPCAGGARVESVRGEQADLAWSLPFWCAEAFVQLFFWQVEVRV
jgi:hypothetical protein